MLETDSAVATCPECEGRGWIVETDGGAGSARPCDCRLNDTGRLIAAAGIPPLYQRCTLEGFTTSSGSAAEREQLLAAKRVCQQYVDEFLLEDGGFCKTGLILVGPPGAGKTHLATAVLSELIRRYRVRGRFVDFTTLVHRIQSTFDRGSDASKHDVLDPITDCELLVLDELGAQQPSEWVKNTLYLILNTRYTRQLPTLFTTNYLLDERPRQPGRGQRASGETSYEQGLSQPPAPSALRPLEERISVGLVSRLCEMAETVEIQVDDYRREIKMQVHTR